MPSATDILFLAAGLGTGGTERHLARLLPGLVAMGLRPRVWNAGEDGAARVTLEAAGIAVHRFKPPESVRHLLRLARLVRSLRRERPDLVHSYLYGRHWLDALACQLAGRPYIGTRRNLAHWRHGPVLGRERWRDRRSGAIVANSRAAAAVAMAEGAEPGRTRVIPNGVPVAVADTDGAARRSARSRLGLPLDARVVGSVASLKAVKDPLTLLRAFAERPGRRLADRLVLVGCGPLEDELRREAAARGVGAQLLLAGMVDEPATLLPALDVFALASLSEGCSNALMEAMAAGLPVVATDVGGNRELVADGESGILVAPGAPESMALALDALLDDGDRAAVMGRAGQERTVREFSLERMIADHADLYQQLLDAGARRG